MPLLHCNPWNNLTASYLCPSCLWWLNSPFINTLNMCQESEWDSRPQGETTATLNWFLRLEHFQGILHPSRPLLIFLHLSCGPSSSLCFQIVPWTPLVKLVSSVTALTLILVCPWFSWSPSTYLSSAGPSPSDSDVSMSTKFTKTPAYWCSFVLPPVFPSLWALSNSGL